MAELTSPEDLVATRESLHRVAEHVLSAALKRETRQIALLPGPGGFRTPALPDGRVLAVIGTDVAVIEGGETRRSPLTTVRAAAEFVGAEPGFPWTKQPPATELEPDAPLALDADAARVLADCYALGAAALDQLAGELSGDAPSDAYIYPEHFDLAITAAEVNYGQSPGDDAIVEPYAYVGPHEGPPARDDFWNAPFGAFRTIREVGVAKDAVAFFLAARERVQDHRTMTRSTS
ncbi:MAG: hypothetical protein ACXV2J_01845 [Actinomycetes bacterium]